VEILRIENLSFSYPGEIKSLRNISLKIDAGEFALICGSSGCGKTTLLKLIKKSLSPYGELKGKILFYGKDIKDLTEREDAGKIGFVLQNPESQIVTDTVWHELAFALENLGFPTELIRRRVAEMASFLGIEDWFFKKTSELSGGQKQLLNLASVMATNPEILLLDEPTAQLDPIAASNFIATLKKINRELGTTVVLVEHRLEEVFPQADKVYLIDSGALAFSGRPQEIAKFFADNPSHPIKAGLPAAMRIFSHFERGGNSPISVRQGRDYIEKTFDNKIKEQDDPPENKNSEAAVSLNNVWFRYQKDRPDILKGVSLEIKKGEHFCLLGGNGAGKSTTVSVIAGLRRAWRGKVLIFKKDINKIPELFGKTVALLPQNPAEIFTEDSLIKDFKTISSDTERIKELAAKLEIFHLLNRHPLDLSGGEQQKAALLKILLRAPQILLLDEPTKAIDANSKIALAAIIKSLTASGITVVTVTHDVEFAAAHADRCALFFGGEIVSSDTPRNFFSDNNFYTTAASRLSRGYFNRAVTVEQVISLCKANGRKGERDV
jgi:energy-coupling factor transporter ATP-binding protein EcfA2